MPRQPLLPLISLAIAACAPAGHRGLPPGSLRGEAVDMVCFTSGLSGFSQVGEDRILLKRSTSEQYVAKLGFCPNLKSVEGLKIDDPGNCLKRGSRLLIYDTSLPLKNSTADRPDRCLVLEIAKLH